MKSFEEFRDEVDQISEIDLGTRKAMARRLKIIGKKASTKFRKEKNKLKALSQDAALKKGMKRARQFVMQKLAGKGKDLADLSVAQKEKLEKRADQAAVTVGGAAASGEAAKKVQDNLGNNNISQTTEKE